MQCISRFSYGMNPGNELERAVGSLELVTWAIINIHTFTAVIPQTNSQFCVLKGIPERVLDLPSCPCYSVGLLWWFDEESRGSRQSWNLFTLVAVVAFQSKLIPEISGETPRRRHPIPRTGIRTRITIRDQILVTIEERLKHWKNDIISLNCQAMRATTRWIWYLPFMVTP